MKNYDNLDTYDNIIVGAGPAGISASLYIARANLKTLIIYYDKSNLQKAQNIQNYYGFEEKITGEDLYLQGIKQAKNIGIETKKEEVIKIEFAESKFKVITTKQVYQSKTIILALGAKKNTVQIQRSQ